MTNGRKYNICLITSPLGNASKAPVLNLVNILLSFSNHIDFITGNIGCSLFRDNQKIHTHGLNYEVASNKIIKILYFIYLQLKISHILLNVAKDNEIIIFFMGANTLLLPILTAKFRRKKVILILSGSFTQTLKFGNDYFYFPVKILERINFNLANFIILYSFNLIEQYKMKKYKHKILIAHRHFLDFNKFKIEKPLKHRNYIVGYVGRLSKEKGVLNFVKAIPKIKNHINSINISIGGDGPLLDEIKTYIEEKNLLDIVRIDGWISYDELPEYLNQFKLLVLPSFTEGLPNIMIEAMACGTPLLATKVGSVPDFIRDGDTGFLMENNSPECIALNIIRVINNSSMGDVSHRANFLVRDEFTYNGAVERYKEILDKII